jgi:hypothetical protein
MKRIIMGIVWFIIFELFFGAIGGLLTSGMTKEQSMATLSKFAPWLFVLSLVLAVVGTVTGKLPGTKKQ